MVQPRFPIFIPSYDRWQEGRHPTMDSLDEMGIPYKIVVREHEYELYVKVFGKEKVLPCPEKFIKDYDTLDKLGTSKSVGPGAQRNYAWEYSKKQGDSFHWVMDDNIKRFMIFQENRQIKVVEGVFFRLMEDFVIKYSNIAMAGPNYFMFVPRKERTNPIIFNTRIYSCNLIRNNLEQRWRGRYNEDTILSLDMLMGNYATVQFNNLLQHKTPTQLIKGGNTKAFYGLEGTYAKSKMLKDVYPNLTTLKIKFHRWHHEVNYKVFKKTKLLKKNPEDIPTDANKQYKINLRKKQ